MAWMDSVSVTDHSGFIQEQLMPQNKDQDANGTAPLYPMPVPQYLQNSHTPLYSLNVECPLQASHADIGRQLAVLFREMAGNFEHRA